ncbi:substrate-binding domain-containing protein [Mesobacillus selenatarsenatis]|uniref:Periplasmic binding protein-related protein n=1 Tax=Mesobacillus selenatarsenatis (strain DSM 18680 / JCM 14380 / FERM P-15431 / SF-1) TaxID=1321606 RepID=A0A0A8WZ96_MESS1|nr:phosphate/phosphite/phosphonate ABC transporter substrate-binding protein [Mesobacillus selenatarsenatis]GAM12299.1 periplasmic binding protein-related protein [Mesobacillus selenatarsenatis SF-1]
MRIWAFIIPILFILMISGCQQGVEQAKITLYTDKAEAFQYKESDPHQEKITVALASVISPKASLSKYDYLLEYMESQIGEKVEIVQRQTYQEVDSMLKTGEVDFAFICSLSYVIGLEKGYIVDVAAPVVNGKPLYHSYTIVNQNSPFEALDDLKGKRFAYTDPYSYTGRLSMLSQLEKRGETSEKYFGKTYFTYSHDYSVKAVELGIVDGATVDGAMFDQLLATDPELSTQIRIIGTGEEAGTPPIVASKKVDLQKVDKFSSILFELQSHAEGRELLKELGVDRYVPINQQDYQVIKRDLYLLGEGL